MDAVAEHVVGTSGARCRFEAQNVVECRRDGGAKKECARYRGMLKRCLLDDWCPDEGAALQRCIDANRSRLDRKALEAQCAPQVAGVERCMGPRLDALQH